MQMPTRWPTLITSGRLWARATKGAPSVTAAAVVFRKSLRFISISSIHAYFVGSRVAFNAMAMPAKNKIGRRTGQAADSPLINS
jgi:hypothetical protein